MFDEHGALLDVDEHPVRKATLTGRAVQNQLVAVQAPGSTVSKWILVSAEPILNAQECIHRLICTYHDITELKLAEEAMRESEERLRFALETSHTGAWDLDLVDHTAFRSLEHDRIFGYVELLPQWTYEMFLDHVLAEDRAAVDAKFRHATETQSDWSFECRIRRTDGEVRWIWAAGRHRSDATGAPRRMAGIVQDITERKQAEQELQKLAAVVRHTREFVNVATLDGKMIFMNDAGADMVGLSAQEIEQTHILQVIPDHLQNKVKNEVLPTLKEKGFWRGELQYRNLRTGRLIDVYVTTFTVKDPDKGTPLFLANTSIDITERKRAAMALREANETLEQKVRERTMDLQNLAEQLDRSRGELRKLASELVMAEERERKRIAGVLHDEIAQTLAAARMRVDMIQGIPSDQKERMKEAKALLVQSIQETRSLMNDLGNPLLFDMGLQAACESLAERLMRTHPVRIRCEIREAYKRLDPDVKTILYQLVRELLNNVVKHSQAQNAHVAIDTENGTFRVKVTDDGVGFDLQALGAPTVESGFGLYSIRERLIAVDGTLSIESAPGAGTTVTAIVPTKMD